MAKKSIIQKDPMCYECGTLEPNCAICGKDFHIKNRKIICDVGPDLTNNHYCLSCYKRRYITMKGERIGKRV